jgi:hypothetical protein
VDKYSVFFINKAIIMYMFKSKESVLTSLKTAILMLALLFGMNFINAAWSDPAGAPTSNNVDAPVNVGSDLQSKSGGIQASYVVGNSSVSVNMVPSGNAEIEASGTKGISFKDTATGYTFRLGRYPGTPANTWLYLTDGSSGYRDFAAGKLYAGSQVCIAGDCRSAWPAGGGGMTAVSCADPDAVLHGFAADGTATCTLNTDGKGGIGRSCAAASPLTILGPRNEYNDETLPASQDGYFRVSRSNYNGLDGAVMYQCQDTVWKPVIFIDGSAVDGGD